MVFTQELRSQIWYQSHEKLKIPKDENVSTIFKTIFIDSINPKAVEGCVKTCVLLLQLHYTHSYMYDIRMISS